MARGQKRIAYIVYYVMAKDQQIYIDSVQGQMENTDKRLRWLEDMKWISYASYWKLPMNEIKDIPIIIKKAKKEVI